MLAWVRRLFATTPRIASLDDLFGIDVRALALVRVLLAATVLFELAIRATSLSAHYGDSSVLPTAAAQAFWDPNWVWSVHLLWNGATPFVAGLFVIQALAALCLLVGYRTRIATIVTWFLYISLINANLLIAAGDGLLRSVLFVGMFMPWGRAYSLDALRAGAASTQRVLSAWTAAFLIQLGYLYLFAMLYKDGAAWVSEGSAVYYTLSNDMFATAFGKYLLHFPALLEFLTFSIVAFQALAPFLLFFPLFLNSLRPVALVGALFMHTSFLATLSVGDFSIIVIAALLAFLPSSFLDWLEVKLSRFFPRLRLATSETVARATGLLPRIGVAASFALGVAYIIYMFWWQAAAVPRLQWPFPENLVVVAKALRIDQQWRLFSPYPPKNDGWMLGIGVRENGSEVDVIQNNEPVSYERPESMAEYFGNDRWRKYFFNIVSMEYQPYYEYYADYLCRSWNTAHAEPEQVEQITLTYMLEETPPPGSPPPEVVPRELFAWNCREQYAL